MRMSRADEGSVLTPPGLRLYVTLEKPVSAFVAVSITNQLFYSGHIRFVLCCQNAAHAFTGPGALILHGTFYPDNASCSATRAGSPLIPCSLPGTAVKITPCGLQQLMLSYYYSIACFSLDLCTFSIRSCSAFSISELESVSIILRDRYFPAGNKIHLRRRFRYE